MDGKKYDGLVPKLLKIGAIVAAVAYVIIVVIATIQGGEFLLNLFGGLIVIPIYIVYGFVIAIVFDVIEKKNKK